MTHTYIQTAEHVDHVNEGKTQVLMSSCYVVCAIVGSLQRNVWCVECAQLFVIFVHCNKHSYVSTVEELLKVHILSVWNDYPISYLE